MQNKFVLLNWCMYFSRNAGFVWAKKYVFEYAGVKNTRGRGLKTLLETAQVWSGIKNQKHYGIGGSENSRNLLLCSEPICKGLQTPPTPSFSSTAEASRVAAQRAASYNLPTGPCPSMRASYVSMGRLSYQVPCCSER